MAPKVPGRLSTKQKSSVAINPFEKKPTSLKYSVLGKVKGSNAQAKSLAVARSEAFQARKQTLLVEAQQAGKSNKFIDRRFAEEQNIPEEDKMLMRFQRERLARVRKAGGSAFNLEDDDDEIITHRGVALGEIDDFGAHEASESDDDDVARDTVKQYHFGGFQPVNSNEEDSERVKTKREVMQEIIAKSKIYKAEKRREKAEKEDMIDQLNADFKDISDLLQSKIRFKEKTPKQGRREKDAEVDPSENKDQDDFDVLAKELAFELRARPSDRLKTPQELEKEEYERLQKAEKERLKRMRGEVDSEEEREGDLKSDKKKVRFAVAPASGDALEDNCLIVGRREKKTRADHAAEKLSNGKASGEEEDGSDGEDEGDDESTGDDSEEDSGEGEGSSEASDAEDEEEQGSSSGGEQQEGDEGDEQHPSHKQHVGKDWADDDVEEQATPRAAAPLGSAAVAAAARRGRDKGAIKQESRLGGSIDELPFVLEMPSAAAELGDLLGLRPKAEQGVILARLLSCHSVSVNPQNKSKLEGLYELLWERVHALAAWRPLHLPSIDAALDALHRVGAAIPDRAAAADAARVAALQEDLSGALAAGRAPEWPAGGDLLLLRGLLSLYPSTDFEHPIVTPLLLLMSQYLTYCPVAAPRHAAAGLWLCAVMHDAVAPAGRVLPEVVAFLTAMVAAALPPRRRAAALPRCNVAHAALAAWKVLLHRRSTDEDGCTLLRLPSKPAPAARKAAPAAAGKAGEIAEVLRLEAVLGDGDDDAAGAGSNPSDEWRLAALESTLRLALGVVKSHLEPSRPAAAAMAGSGSKLLQADASLAAALMLAPLAQAAAALQPLLAGGGWAAQERTCGEMIRAVGDLRRRGESRGERLTLYAAAPVPIRQFVPRFEERFAPGTDADPDRERAERNRLRKRVRRELKGAVRELRKDNAFLEDQRARQVAVQRRARDERAKGIETFLAQQQHEAKIGAGKRSRRR